MTAEHLPSPEPKAVPHEYEYDTNPREAGGGRGCAICGHEAQHPIHRTSKEQRYEDALTLIRQMTRNDPADFETAVGDLRSIYDTVNMALFAGDAGFRSPDETPAKPSYGVFTAKDPKTRESRWSAEGWWLSVMPPNSPEKANEPPGDRHADGSQCAVAAQDPAQASGGSAVKAPQDSPRLPPRYHCSRCERTFQTPEGRRMHETVHDSAPDGRAGTEPR